MMAVVSKIPDPAAHWLEWFKSKYQVDVTDESGSHVYQVGDEQGVAALLSVLRDAACKRGSIFQVYNHSGEPPGTFGIKPEELVR